MEYLKTMEQTDFITGFYIEFDDGTYNTNVSRYVNDNNTNSFGLYGHTLDIDIESFDPLKHIQIKIKPLCLLPRHNTKLNIETKIQIVQSSIDKYIIIQNGNTDTSLTSSTLKNALTIILDINYPKLDLNLKKYIVNSYLIKTISKIF